MNDLQGIEKQLNKRKQPTPPVNPVDLTNYFADLIWGLLDTGSGLGVWYITGYWYYGLMVFFAGIVPLLLWQKMIVQPYANANQKGYAEQGEKLAIWSVIAVSVTIAIIRFIVDGVYVEAALAIALLGIAARHGFLARLYYYADEGIINRQMEAQMMAEAVQIGKEAAIARRVLDAHSLAAEERKGVERDYSPTLVSKALREENVPKGTGQN